MFRFGRRLCFVAQFGFSNFGFYLLQQDFTVDVARSRTAKLSGDFETKFPHAIVLDQRACPQPLNLLVPRKSRFKGRIGSGRNLRRVAAVKLRKEA